MDNKTAAAARDMVVKHRRLGYCKEKSIQMIMSLRFLLTAFLGVLLLLMLSTGLTYRVAVHSIVNRTFVPTLLLYKDLLSARPGYRRVINQTTTLLSYAAIEVDESEERRLINSLLNSSNLLNRSGIHSISLRNMIRPMSLRNMPTKREREMQATIMQYSFRGYAAHMTEFHRALKSWVKNKTFHPQVMAEIRDLVKTPLDRHYNGTHALEIRPGQPYQNCAVVGNSGILLHNTHGSLIDSHEMVIRLNNARTSGFGYRVGSKTTLAFINSNILHRCARRTKCMCHPYGENVPIMMYICQAVHFLDFAFCKASHKAPLLVTDPRFDKLCGRVVKYYSLKNFVETTGKNPEEWSAAHEGPLFHYSSGMQAVMLALGICKNVSLFGFGKSPHAKHHYHTNQTGEFTLHDYEAEYQLYRDLADGSPDIPFLSEAGIQLPPVQIYL